MRDAKRFVQNNRWIIDHAPTQLYCSALLFCPRKSKVRLYYEHLIPEWISTKPDTQENTNPELYTLHGHSGSIIEVAFSPTEPLLVSTSDDNTTRVWDYITGSEQYRFQDPGQPETVCFSKDGMKIASGCLDGTVCVRNLKTTTDTSFYCLFPIRQVSFSPTASNILAAFCKDGMLYRWNLDDKQQELCTHTWERETFHEFVFSPNGQTIAVCWNHSIVVFDVVELKVVSRFKVLNMASKLAFSIDSSILAVRQDDSIDFWDVISSSPKLINSYKASWSYHTFLRLQPDQNVDFCQSPSGTIELSEISTGRLIGEFQRALGSTSRDGALLADITSDHPVIRVFSDPSAPSLQDEETSAPDNVELLEGGIALSYNDDGFYGDYHVTQSWDVLHRTTKPFMGFVRTIRTSPDGSFVLLKLNEGAEFQIWRKGLREPHTTFDKMADIAFDPHTGHPVTLSLSGHLQYLKWDTESCIFKPTWDFKLKNVAFKQKSWQDCIKASRLYLSPSGQEAIVNTDGPRVGIGGNLTSKCQLWNLRTKAEVKTISGPEICRIEFSPTNDFFSIEYDSPNETKLFSLSDGQEIKDCALDGYTSLTFHPTESTFAVRSREGNDIEIWESLPWIKRFSLQGAQDHSVKNLALSATKIAAWSSRWCKSSTVDIWDFATGQKLYSHAFSFSGRVASFNISADETWVESNRGRIPLLIQDTTDGSPSRQWEGIQNCLYVLDEWILQGHERLLWLPAEYRPSSIQGRNIDVRGGMIALAHKNNSAVFIGISLERTPIAERYMRLDC